MSQKIQPFETLPQSPARDDAKLQSPQTANLEYDDVESPIKGGGYGANESPAEPALPFSKKIIGWMGPLDKFAKEPKLNYRGSKHYSKCGICWTLAIYLGFLAYGIWMLYDAAREPLVTSIALKGIKDKIDFNGQLFCFIGGPNTPTFQPTDSLEDTIVPFISKKSKYGPTYNETKDVVLEYVPYQTILDNLKANDYDGTFGDYDGEADDEEDGDGDGGADDTDDGSRLLTKTKTDDKKRALASTNFPGVCVKVTGKAANVNLETSIGMSVIDYDYFDGDIIVIMAFYYYVKLDDKFIPQLSLASEVLYQNKSAHLTFGLEYTKEEYQTYSSPVDAVGKNFKFALLSDSYLLSSDGDIDVIISNTGTRNYYKIQYTTIPSIIAAVNGLIGIAVFGIGLIFGGFMDFKYYENSYNRVQNNGQELRTGLYDRFIYTFGDVLGYLTCRCCTKKKPISTPNVDKLKATKKQFEEQLELSHYLKKVK